MHGRAARDEARSRRGRKPLACPHAPPLHPRPAAAGRGRRRRRRRPAVPSPSSRSRRHVDHRAPARHRAGVASPARPTSSPRSCGLWGPRLRQAEGGVRERWWRAPRLPPAPGGGRGRAWFGARRHAPGLGARSLLGGWPGGGRRVRPVGAAGRPALACGQRGQRGVHARTGSGAPPRGAHVPLERRARGPQPPARARQGYTSDHPRASGRPSPPPRARRVQGGGGGRAGRAGALARRS
jgi:hypothetical protein